MGISANMLVIAPSTCMGERSPLTGKRPSSLAVRGLMHAGDEGRPVSGGPGNRRRVRLEREVEPWP